MMSKFVSSALALGLVLVALAGCSGNIPSVGSAPQALCSALDDLKTAVGRLANIDAETTVEEIKEMKQGVDRAVQAVKAANQVLQLAPIDDLTAAYDNLTRTIDGLSDSETLGAATSQVQAAVQAINAAFDQANSALKCD